MQSANTVRLGIVGIGGWGKNVLRAFGMAEGAEVAALCDPDPSRLAAAKDHFPQAAASPDYQWLLTRGDLDAIVLATPAEMHYPMARAALEAGKHVYVEKPLTLASADAETLVVLAEQANRKLMVGHLLEYHPAVDAAKQMLDSGEMGALLSIVTRRLNLGVVRHTENAFWSLGPHDVSVALYLLGQEPNRIEASGACFLQPGIEDTVVASLAFPGGQLVNIHVSWLDPRKVREMVIVGTRGMLVFDEMASDKLVFHDKRAEKASAGVAVHAGDARPVALSGGQPLDVEAQHFVDAIRYDRPVRSDGRDGLRVVRILERVENILRDNRSGGER